MTDAAAFFANKKKKKKAFKFNANLIDASTVTSSVHVDAPALSTVADHWSSATETAGSSLPISPSAADGTAGGTVDAQWDDEALAAATTRKGTTVAAPNGAFTKDWADLKALDLKTSGNEQDDIAKKLRVEETRAQLAAAREGMEREAQRIKEEKERKEHEAKDKTSTRFGSAAGTSGSGAGVGGKWVPTRMRAGGVSLSDRFGGAGGSQKLDTEDENLFPDLASADAIMEKKKHEQPAYMAVKKTPVGGGATWGSRPKLNLKPKSHTVKEDESQPTDTQEAKEVATPPDAAPQPDQPTASAEAKEDKPTDALESGAEGPVAAGPAPAPMKPKKNKKKDISTFGKK